MAKPRHVYVILNAAATGFLHRPVREISGAITTAFNAHGITAEVLLAFGGSLKKRTTEAVAGGAFDAVVAGGGDGTVSNVAAALVDSGLPLGVLPLGRFNHFARDLGIPAELEQAVALIAAGNAVTIDSGEVNGRSFINNSSV